MPATSPRRTEPLIRVHLADDHAVVREGVSSILAETPDIVVVGQAASGAELISLVLAEPADVCLLDVGMSGGGLELAARLHELRPTMRTLIFSMYPAEQYAVRALEAKAAGYLSKGCQRDEIPEAIRRVASGRRYISDEVGELLASHVIQGSESEPHVHLSNREHDIFLRIARGQSPGEIAEQLGLSVKSVRTYRTRVLGKLGLERNAELTKYALEHALID